MPKHPSRPRRSLRSRRRIFEVLEHRALLAADFGDAPAPYPTLLLENGAQHVAIGPSLGATRDVEVDGAHSAGADADGADEDGVSFGIVQAGDFDASVTVNVQGTAAKLDAWIDFNGDGSWGGPGEQIFASQAVATGDNLLTFDVPSWAADGTTYARFRLSSSGGLGPAGAAIDGEVEDYAITIALPDAASGAFKERSLITNTAGYPDSLSIADVDGDGDLDFFVASGESDTISWYENNNQTFTAHSISTAADVAYSVQAVDLDGDGDMDAVSASAGDNKVAWYENDGNQNFTTHIIATDAIGVRSVVAADVDGDGDQDVLAAARWDDRVVWYENDGSQTFTLHTISATAGGAYEVAVGDMDADGDLDVIAAAPHHDRIDWYENDGNQNFTQRSIAAFADFTKAIAVADVDSDGDLDVLAGIAHEATVAWYENDGSQNFTKHVIATPIAGPVDVSAADIDGDGDLDVLYTGQYSEDKVGWFENDGSQNFTDHVISGEGDGSNAVVAGDVDGDGDLDILAASGYDEEIAWSENNWPSTLTNNGAVVRENGVVTIGTAQLSTTDLDDSAAELHYEVINHPSRPPHPAHGQLELVTAPGVRVTRFTQAMIDANQLVYRHDGSETTADSFKFTVTDTAGNVLTDFFHFEITPTNDAPVLNNSFSPTLATTDTDATDPPGTRVYSLVSNAITDVDVGARKGIAVSVASDFHGTWQYSLDDRRTWQAMGASTELAARLLPATAFVRFLPNAGFNGTVKMYYRAWDQTAGIPGGTLNAYHNKGGANSLSTAYESASLTVRPINDPPKLALGGTLGYVHDSPAITLAPGALVSDVDSPDFYQGRLRVWITDGASTSNRLVIGSGFTVDGNNNVLQGTTIIGRRVSSGFGTSELRIVFTADATPTVVQQLVRAIGFKTVGGAAGARKILFTVSDGDGGVSGEATKWVNVT